MEAELNICYNFILVYVARNSRRTLLNHTALKISDLVMRISAKFNGNYIFTVLIFLTHFSYEIVKKVHRLFKVILNRIKNNTPNTLNPLYCSI
jgi:fucose 4-O-acetylase-like acetyltransferase